MKRLVIGLAGYKGVGKTTVANALVKHFGFTNLAFADPLKEMICGLLGVPVKEWDAIKDKPIDPGNVEFTPRDLATGIGTDLVRNQLQGDFWIWHLRCRAGARATRPLVISDVRYDDEARAVRKMGGKVIQLDREGVTRSSDHTSEDGVSATFIDERVWISGTPRDAALAVLQAVSTAGKFGCYGPFASREEAEQRAPRDANAFTVAHCEHGYYWLLDVPWSGSLLTGQSGVIDAGGSA